jgi:hypothetical protein
MDNDALNSVDQFERAISAALERLRGLAPAAIQDRIGRGDPRRRCRIFRPHDADQDIERGPGLVWLRASERISVSDFGTWAHLQITVANFSSTSRRGCEQRQL